MIKLSNYGKTIVSLASSKRPAVFFLLAVSVFAVLLTPASAFADSAGIGGKPANPIASNPRTKSIFVKTVEPGKSVDDAVSVMNNSDTAKTILVYSTDSVKSSGGAFACAQAVDAPVSVGKWLTLAQTSIEVPANSTVNVPFTLSIPNDTEPGEQNGCIVLQEKKEATLQSGIALSFRTAIRVAVLIPGAINKSIEAESISLTSKGNTITVSPTVKNTGNVSLDVDVKSKISTIFGATVAEHQETFPALRDQVTTWNLDFSRPYWGGLYVARYDIAYDNSTNFIGETDSKTDIKTVQGPTKLFFAMPNLLAACIELFIAILIAGAVIRYRMVVFNRRIVEEKWVNHKVGKTEQIQDIANKAGISWKTLAKANHIKAPYNLVAGDTIKVPHVQKEKKSQAKHKSSEE